MTAPAMRTHRRIDRRDVWFREPRHLRRIAFLIGFTLSSTLFQLAQADQLRGQLTGFPEPDAHVDLLVRFFDADDERLGERQFEGVRLVRGAFVLSVDASTMPARAASVEIALRPAARHYAAFQPIEPRRPIQRIHHGIRVASTSSRTAAVRTPASNEVLLVATGVP